MTPTKPRYVMTGATDPSQLMAVGIAKLKGPASLLNLVTFPGGGMEGNETLAHAASREMLEETGMFVSESDWAGWLANSLSQPQKKPTPSSMT